MPHQISKIARKLMAGICVIFLLGFILFLT